MSYGSFTRPSPRYKVPHDRIGVRWVLVAHLAVTRAFELIRQEGFDLRSSLENDVTVKLETILNNQVLNRGEVDGFDRNFFGKVRRVEVVNFDGTKKAKKPDLCFDLQREGQIEWDKLQDALFAECKPVDKHHSLRAHYCAVGKDCTGIERFVIGDYAWAVEEALMIGYVRDGFQIEPHLKTALKEKTRAKLGRPTPPLEISSQAILAVGVRLYVTTHGRTFVWKGVGPASSIDIFHSWHACD